MRKFEGSTLKSNPTWSNIEAETKIYTLGDAINQSYLCVKCGPLRPTLCFRCVDP